MNDKIEDIAVLLKAKAVIVHKDRIEHLLTDSRNMLFPEDTLFFALKTESNDGHKYINDLYRRGLRNFVVSSSVKDVVEPDANVLTVPDTLMALQVLAADIRQRFRFPVLALAGSNGKTIVKEWLWQLLRDDLKISRSPGSFNSQTGVPLSLSMVDEDSDLAIIEAGISKRGEMAVLQKMIKPQWGLITNIGPAHQENFKSRTEKLREKFMLFSECQHLVYCADDPDIAAMAENLLESKYLYGWSCEDVAARIYFHLDTHEEYTLVHTLWHRGEVNFLLPYVDSASIQNALHCIAFLFLLEEESDYRIEPSVLAARLKELEPVAMRLEVKEGKNDCVLINDAYNSDLQALELALDFQSRRPMAKNMKRALILSDIYQSGQKPENLYRAVAEMVKKKMIDRFVGVGKDLASCSALFPASSHFFLSTDDFLASSLPDALHNELILIKGSRKFGFERISEQLSLRSHATVMEVDLDAIVHNMRYFRSLLKPETQMVAMVKAEAYGHGALEVSKTLQEHGCDAVAVAVADEGVRLRQGGINMPIFVMNPEPEIFPICYEYHLEPEVYSFKLLNAFIQAGEWMGVKDYPIHVKLDTGMHRLGFSEADLPKLISILKSQQVLRVKTVFSHLAGSDEDSFDDYTQTQWALFDKMSKNIQEKIPYKMMRHLLNSAGIERFPQWQCDMVRLGIGLYGVSVAHPHAVKPTACLKTNILQIHEYKMGDTIGYSRTTKLERDSRIATLPIGYADGFNRLNRGGYVLLNGCQAKVMGSICMDVCMIDVTDIPAHEGDTVVIFGKGLPLTEVAARLNTIPYEVLTSVSARVKRVYYHE